MWGVQALLQTVVSTVGASVRVAAIPAMAAEALPIYGEAVISSATVSSWLPVEVGKDRLNTIVSAAGAVEAVANTAAPA
jgi:hypothetical protein